MKEDERNTNINIRFLVISHRKRQNTIIYHRYVIMQKRSMIHDICIQGGW